MGPIPGNLVFHCVISLVCRGPAYRLSAPEPIAVSRTGMEMFGGVLELIAGDTEDAQLSSPVNTGKAGLSHRCRSTPFAYDLMKIITA